MWTSSNNSNNNTQQNTLNPTNNLGNFSQNHNMNNQMPNPSTGNNNANQFSQNPPPMNFSQIPQAQANQYGAYQPQMTQGYPGLNFSALQAQSCMNLNPNFSQVHSSYQPQANFTQDNNQRRIQNDAKKEDFLKQINKQIKAQQVLLEQKIDQLSEAQKQLIKDQNEFYEKQAKAQSAQSSFQTEFTQAIKQELQKRDPEAQIILVKKLVEKIQLDQKNIMKQNKKNVQVTQANISENKGNEILDLDKVKDALKNILKEELGSKLQNLEKDNKPDQLLNESVLQEFNIKFNEILCQINDQKLQFNDNVNEKIDEKIDEKVNDKEIDKTQRKSLDQFLVNQKELDIIIDLREEVKALKQQLTSLELKKDMICLNCQGDKLNLSKRKKLDSQVPTQLKTPYIPQKLNQLQEAATQPNKKTIEKLNYQQEEDTSDDDCDYDEDESKLSKRQFLKINKEKTNKKIKEQQKFRKALGKFVQQERKYNDKKDLQFSFVTMQQEYNCLQMAQKVRAIMKDDYLAKRFQRLD